MIRTGVRNEDLAQGYAALIGVVLVLAGVLGFVDDPLVGDPASNPVLVTGTAHDIVHLVTGGIALYIAFALSGRREADGVIAFGLLHVAILVTLLVDADLFGIFGYLANVADLVLHAAVGFTSIAVGYLARGPVTPVGPRA